MANKAYIYILCCTEVFAHSIVQSGLSNAHLLNIAPTVEIGYTKYQTPSFKFDGKIENNFISTSSNDTNKYYNSLHILTPIVDEKYRFSISYTEDTDTSYSFWENPIMSHYAHNYEVQYTKITPQVSYLVSDNLAVSMGVHLTKAKAGFHLTYLPIYDVSMEGNGIDESLFFSCSYRPYSPLLLSGSYTTHTTIDLKGNASGKINNQETASAGRTDVNLPKEYEIGGTIFFSDTAYLYLGYKHRYWEINKSLNLDFEDSTYETMFGKESPRKWNARHITKAVFGDSYKDISLQGIVGKSVGGHNINNSTVSTPIQDVNFYGVNASYKLTKTDTIGTRYIQYFLNDTIANSSTFSGHYDDTTANTISVYYRKSF